MKLARSGHGIRGLRRRGVHLGVLVLLTPKEIENSSAKLAANEQQSRRETVMTGLFPVVDYKSTDVLQELVPTTKEDVVSSSTWAGSSITEAAGS